MKKKHNKIMSRENRRVVNISINDVYILLWKSKI